MNTHLIIEHDPIGQKFTCEVNKEECFLAYTVINDNLNLHFMAVPDGDEGEIVADELTSAAFDFARQNNVKIISSSAYVDEIFLKNHPECEEFIEKD